MTRRVCTEVPSWPNHRFERIASMIRSLTILDHSWRLDCERPSSAISGRSLLAGSRAHRYSRVDVLRRPVRPTRERLAPEAASVQHVAYEVIVSVELPAAFG